MPGIYVSVPSVAPEHVIDLAVLPAALDDLIVVYRTVASTYRNGGLLAVLADAEKNDKVVVLYVNNVNDVAELTAMGHPRLVVRYVFAHDFDQFMSDINDDLDHMRSIYESPVHWRWEPEAGFNRGRISSFIKRDYWRAQ